MIKIKQKILIKISYKKFKNIKIIIQKEKLIMELNLNILNDVQLRAVKCTEGPVIVSAGAGSGKTRVLTYRVANLILNHGVNPSNILAITFTNKAAKEMRERLDKMDISQGTTICTFHALGVKILRECHNYIAPRTKFFSIYDETDKKNLIKKIVKNIDSQDKMVDAYINFISNAKNAGITPEEYTNFYGGYGRAEITQKIYKEYEIELEKNNAYDFDDLLCKTYDILSSIKQVKEFYSDKFRYILVDEFQDTNEIQYKILTILQSKFHNLFVVGDEDQSIYSWRGADSKNMLRFIKDYGCTNVFKLEQNYRSTEKILKAANTIISKNTNRLDKSLWTEKNGGSDVEFKCYGDEMKESENIVKTIYNLHLYGENYKDIAVLCRMNALTRSLEDKCLNYNIPYRIYGGVKFYDRLEVKNVLAYLKCVVNPKDDESFLRIINYPKRKIGEAAIKNLKAIDPSKSYMDILMSLNASVTGKEDNQMDSLLDILGVREGKLCNTGNLTKAQITSFLKVQELFSVMKANAETMPVSLIVENLLRDIDIENYYDKNDEEDLSRLMNIRELQSAIKEFEKENPDATLEDYLQAVTLTSDIDSYDEEEDAITIATVHAVKGLEFSDVFIVGLEEGIFPLIRVESNGDDDMEEERRLMYVAVTRAKEKLYLSCVSSRFLHGKRNDSMPSRYLKDLGYIKPMQRPVFDEDRQGGYGSYYKNSRGNDYYSDNFTIYGHNTDNTDIVNRVAAKPSKSNTFMTIDSPFKGNQIKNQGAKKTYYKGQKVKHAKFGMGVVIDFNQDSHIVQIAFAGLGVKKLDSTIAVLEEIKD